MRMKYYIHPVTKKRMAVNNAAMALVARKMGYEEVRGGEFTLKAAEELERDLNEPQ